MARKGMPAASDLVCAINRDPCYYFFRGVRRFGSLRQRYTEQPNGYSYCWGHRIARLAGANASIAPRISVRQYVFWDSIGYHRRDRLCACYETTNQRALMFLSTEAEWLFFWYLGTTLPSGRHRLAKNM
jgi:hypothetical protein